MTFDELLAEVIALLQRQGRVSYRALKLRFTLDDDYLDGLKDEIIHAQRLAVDEDGRVLVWAGPAAPTPAAATSVPLAVPQSITPAVAPAAPSPPAIPGPAAAERRQLTVMFCDLVASTRLAGQLDPEDLRDVVRAYQAACAEAVRHFGGQIAQYLGDGLLIYFGYPLAHEDDAPRAVHTALAILEAMQQLNSRLERERRVRLAVRLGIHTGRWSATWAAVPLLAALLSLPHPESYPPLTLSPQRQKQRTREALVAWLLEEAERQPVLAIWEDLHWADPSTLEWLGGLLEQVPTVRLLTLLTHRPEFRPPWPPRSHVTPLALMRLTRPQIEAMVTRVTGGKPLPAAVVQQIVVRTDGVPLFVEEIVKAVLETGLVQEEADRYVLTGPLPTLAIPATLPSARPSWACLPRGVPSGTKGFRLLRRLLTPAAS